jgi:hypothetical protein
MIALDGGVDQGVGVVLDAEVGPDEGCVATSGAQVGGDGGAPRLVAPGDYHGCALGDEQASDLLAQTRRRARDDGDVAGQAARSVIVRHVSQP